MNKTSQLQLVQDNQDTTFNLFAPQSDEEIDALIEQRKREVNFFHRLVEEVLEEGVDYGRERGIKEPFIRAPGAQQVKLTCGLKHRFVLVEQIIDLDREYPHICYTYKCELLNSRGEYLGDRDSSCSNYESKHRYIYKDGKKMDAPDPLGKINTISAIAQKRAYVAAIKYVTGVSRLFVSEEEIERIKDLSEDLPQKTGSKGKKKSSESYEDNPGKMPVPFGRNKGKLLEEIDMSDLQWLYSKTKYDNVKAVIKAHMEDRLKKESDNSPEPAGNQVALDQIAGYVNSKDIEEKRKARKIAIDFLAKHKLEKNLVKIPELNPQQANNLLDQLINELDS